MTTDVPHQATPIFTSLLYTHPCPGSYQDLHAPCHSDKMHSVTLSSALYTFYSPQAPNIVFTTNATFLFVQVDGWRKGWCVFLVTGCCKVENKFILAPANHRVKSKDHVLCYFERKIFAIKLYKLDSYYLPIGGVLLEAWRTKQTCNLKVVIIL